MQDRIAISLFIFGYLFSVAIGSLLLQLSFCQQAPIALLDILFLAVSAVSTTGLSTIDIGTTFTLAGQMALLLLTQIGGIGYMVFTSYVLLRVEKKEIPIRRLIHQVLTYTVLCETCGALLLYFFFIGNEPLWNALFHSVSAFCTAGFSLFSSNFESYKHHFGINITLALLSLLGAFGFFLWIDLSKLKGMKFTSRVARPFISSTILISSVLFMQHMGGWMISFFHTVSALTTAGFNSIPLATLSQFALTALIFLMLAGGALTGSGTHMRGTTFSAIVKLLGRPLEACWNNDTFVRRVAIAMTTFIYYGLAFIVFGSILAFIEKQPILPILFESASALCSVGMSTGITSELSLVGKSLIILLMLGGRTGILIFGFITSLKEIVRKSVSL